ncbi:MAG TPA: MFS transporter [Gemmatimonadales bacterium]
MNVGTTAEGGAAVAVPPSTAWRLLIVVTLVNLFNYIDRYIVPAIATSLRTSALHLDRTQIGLLATGFIVVYAVASPRFGSLGDRRHRPRLIALGVVIWSAATVLGGFAWGFISLFVARAILGVGEAAYGSITPSLLADAFPKSKRGRIFSIFFAAIPIGSALGYLLAGEMDAHFGWRSAFWVAGVPGLILAAFLVRLPEVPRGAHDDPADASIGAALPAGLGSYTALLRNRQYLLTVLGYAAYTFSIGALAWWMVDFLTTMRGVPTHIADREIGLIAVATGFAGTLGGGWLGDYLLRYTARAYLLMSGVATILAAPFAYLALTARTPAWYLTGLIVAELLAFASTGPINSAIVNAVAPAQRATAMALSLLLMHLLGDAPSPWIVGWIADSGVRAGLSDGAALRQGMLILPAVFVISGIIWMIGGLRREA